MTDFKLATHYAWWHNLSATAARDLAKRGKHEDAARYGDAAVRFRRRYIREMQR